MQICSLQPYEVVAGTTAQMPPGTCHLCGPSGWGAATATVLPPLAHVDGVPAFRVQLMYARGATKGDAERLARSELGRYAACW
jgi:hypothetical protein